MTLKKRLKRRLRFLHPDHWHWLLRMVLLFQGQEIELKDTKEELKGHSEEERAAMKADLQSEFVRFTARIVSSPQITVPLLALQGALFIALFFADPTDERREVLKTLGHATNILIWSLISGLQYLVLFMERNPVERTKKNLDPDQEFHDLKELVVNRKAKATMISICQTISGLLTIVTIYKLVGLFG